jgi:hypothetical protein
VATWSIAVGKLVVDGGVVVRLISSAGTSARRRRGPFGMRPRSIFTFAVAIAVAGCREVIFRSGMFIAVISATSRFLRIALALSLPPLRILIRTNAIHIKASGAPRRTGNDIARVLSTLTLALATLTDEFILAFNLGFFV